eukprot:6214308-Pleurochrysis_carterae.AAC.2
MSSSRGIAIDRTIPVVQPPLLSHSPLRKPLHHPNRAGVGRASHERCDAGTRKSPPTPPTYLLHVRGRRESESVRERRGLGCGGVRWGREGDGRSDGGRKRARQREGKGEGGEERGARERASGRGCRCARGSHHGARRLPRLVRLVAAVAQHQLVASHQTHVALGLKTSTHGRRMQRARRCARARARARARECAQLRLRMLSEVRTCTNACACVVVCVHAA